MEYEIGDDPQGVPDELDGHRDGGLRVSPIFFCRAVSTTQIDRHDDARDEDPAMRQFGEVA